MSNPVSIKVTGFDELANAFGRLSQESWQEVAEAVDEGAKILQTAIAQEAPQGTVGDFQRAGAFDIKNSRTKGGVFVWVAPSSKMKSTMKRWKKYGAMTLAALALWCEFGHVTVKEGDPGVTKSGKKRSKNYLASHGFRTAKNPFFTRAYKMSQDKIKAAIEAHMSAWLSKQGK